ncbi:hypothetical protein LJC36_03500 [Desulfovibrio sp. OttesenSCG-928-C14]|nr:hypothetical protein [Desulfovibrio sp. OttesenSCG-928-C14]
MEDRESIGAAAPESLGEDACRIPLPGLYSGFMIFDCLVIGGIFLFFCLFCLDLPQDAHGQYPFLRRGMAMAGSIRLLAGLSLLAMAAGAVLLYLRLTRVRRFLRAYPEFAQAMRRAAQARGKGQPGVFASMGDACKQLMGLQLVAETPEEAEARKARMEKEERIKAGKRNFRAWLRQPKTRMALSSALLFMAIYLMPRELAARLGQHVLMLYMLQFASFMATLVLLVVAWVEPD